jgi:DNA-binding NarL/FixJ family response regulator
MKILVVDDHALIRDALQGLMKKLKRGAVVLEASDSRQAMEVIARESELSLVLLDLNLPDRDGFLVLADIRERYPAIAVVVLSALQDRAKVMRALELGSAGYIPKSVRREVMISALQLVFAGGVYIPPEVQRGRKPPMRCRSPQAAIVRSCHRWRSGSRIGNSRCWPC